MIKIIKKFAGRTVLLLGILLVTGLMVSCQKADKKILKLPSSYEEGAGKEKEEQAGDADKEGNNVVLEDIVVEKKAPIGQEDFLKAKDRNLRNKSGEGDVVNLRGTNVGGWLLQEFWMTPTAPGSEVKAESDVYRYLEQQFGKDSMYEMIKLYQDNYFTEKDLDNCQSLGINCLRLPFWYRNIVDENGEFYPEWYTVFDWFIKEAGERGMYVILDFHGAPGSQSGSDHSGVDGGDDKMGASHFFFGDSDTVAKNQELFYTIWDAIASRYAENPVVAGYDLLNEPYCTYRYSSGKSDEELHRILWDVYDKAYDRVRALDKDHVIILEATWDPVDLPAPEEYGWENIMYEYHNYLYDDYDNKNGQQIANMKNKVNAIAAADYNVPSYLGEFNYFNSIDAWDEGLALLTDAGLNWTTWTYKVVSEYGNWGLYNQSVGEVTLENTSREYIEKIWEKVGDSQENKELAYLVTKYCVKPVVENSLGLKEASLTEGDYSLKGVHSGLFVAVQEDGKLRATEGTKGGSFHLKVQDGVVFLQAEDQSFITVDKDTKILSAGGKKEEDAEKFLLLELSDAVYALKSTTTGKYVCTDENLEGNPLVADRDKPDSWESFWITGK